MVSSASLRDRWKGLWICHCVQLMRERRIPSNSRSAVRPAMISYSRQKKHTHSVQLNIDLILFCLILTQIPCTSSHVIFVTFYLLNQCWCAFSAVSLLGAGFVIVFFWNTIDFLTALKVPGIQSLHVLSQALNSALVEDLTGLRKEKTHHYTLFLAHCGGFRDWIHLDPRFPPALELWPLCPNKYCFIYFNVINFWVGPEEPMTFVIFVLYLLIPEIHFQFVKLHR